ncbi:FadR family transcriptional regulator [Silicimonas algicola]|uniref:GntR family transcriptional regulator n=1 Tax=Silicimonas algicola TaxID=1826607 RepID=A0A316FZC3_9RHOB|nr:FadR/GntR family transcriptional regulator [Silicimonas algicola]AZQ69063.1 FadR family transcriptional regulator [Silicimonas algicola]PWK54044.1 GntR family transcriptional regulator [Silicimonas algicola]
MVERGASDGGRAASVPGAGWQAPLVTVSGASNLANLIGRDIVSGRLGETLLPSEVEMRERYAVSRTALREAYSKLAAKGLVAARPKVGTSVRPRADWNMLDQDVLAWHLQTSPVGELFADLYALRKMIEPAAADLAARIRTDDDLTRIDAAFERMTESRGSALVEADYEFHVSILTATQNRFILSFSGLIKAAMLSAFEVSWSNAGVVLVKTRIGQHGEVARAIRDGKGETARRIMAALLEDSIGDVRAALDKGRTA